MQFHSWFLLSKDSHHPPENFTQSVGPNHSNSPVETLQQLITLWMRKQNYNKCTHTHTPLWSVHRLLYLRPSYWKRNTHSITHPSLQRSIRRPLHFCDNTTLPTPDHLAKVRPLFNKIDERAPVCSIQIR